MGIKASSLSIALILIVGLAGQAMAGVGLASELLLPYFVVDLADPAGVTTLFSVGNAGDEAVSLRIEVYSNWGILIVSSSERLEPDEVRSVNLRDWISNGKLMDRQLASADLDHLQAALTGQRSPVDDLYYSSWVDDGEAVGYVTVTLEGASDDVLFGDYFVVNPAEDFAQGSLLVSMSGADSCSKGLCDRHALRFLDGGAFAGGTEVVIWTGVTGSPSSDGFFQSDNKTEVGAEFFDEPGRRIDFRDLSLLPVEVVNIADLALSERFGWMALDADVQFWVGVSYSAQNRFSVGFESFCLPRKRTPLPGITIEKATNDHDADLAPGPSIAVGTRVRWTYEVTNTGQMELTGIVVSDDDPSVEVSCPKDTLAPGESMTCSARGTAQACQYANLGSVYGYAPNGSLVEDEDPSHYMGEAHTAIDIEKATNGHDADQAPGVELAAGDAVEWTYVVTNTGDATLYHIRVDDDKEGRVSCPRDTLSAGESMTCSLSGIAAEGQYANLSHVRGETECGSEVTDRDPSHYWVPTACALASIDVEKATNGRDADSEPGPSIPVGNTVNWTYVVTNTGDVDLADIELTDDQLGAISCPRSSLASGQSMTCRASGTAQACQYRNVARVKGFSECDGSEVDDSDASHYFGTIDPSIHIEKATNGHDADQSPGVELAEDDAVQWTYVVTNTGNAPLSGIEVVDNREGAVSCPKSALAAGESMTCSASGTAAVGYYSNVGTVTGLSECGDEVSDSDPSHYWVPTPCDPPAIDLEKATNGHDADAAPGPSIAVGNQVNWTYVITNTGGVDLENIHLDDDQLGTVSCPKSTLEPGKSMTCTATGVAEACQYRNVATVTASSACDESQVSDSDASHYFGQGQPSIRIEKATNGYDADSGPGVELKVGDAVTWTYVVTNTGNLRLEQVAVSDDKEGAVSCPKSALEPGESMTCSLSGTAKAAVAKTGNSGTSYYSNVGTATATTECGDEVSDSDPSHYWTRKPCDNPKIHIEKATNGYDADSGPGVELKVGDAITWTYVVTNTGDAPLEQVSVSDDKEGPVSCPKSALEPGESMTCSLSGTAKTLTCGKDDTAKCNNGNYYRNVGTARGRTECGKEVSDSDPSHYWTRKPCDNPKIHIEKATNGYDADSGPGVELSVGDTVTWTYVVTNTGDAPLEQVSVSDDKEGSVSCPKSTLEPGESMTCSLSGTAKTLTCGKDDTAKCDNNYYRNVGTARGKTECGKEVSDSDPSHYWTRKSPKYQGCTPGYWKNHLDSWPAAGYSPSQSISSVFGNAFAYGSLSSATLHEALYFDGGSGVEAAARILMRAAVAGLLDASHPDVNYPWSASTLISKVNAALASGDRSTMLDLASHVDYKNNLGCPLN